MMNGKIKVRVKAGSHWTGIDSSKVYTAEVCKDNGRIIFWKMTMAKNTVILLLILK